MQLDRDKLRQTIEPLFQENFERFGELGAAVSIWQHGRPILELHGGFREARRESPWTEDTIVLFWSATKGLGAACLLHVLQEHGIALQRRVAEFWPEFAGAGKGEITLAQLMSHQAGLSALDRRVDVLDYPAVIHALEVQAPVWPAGSGHGYHARTFGYLLDELARRISGTTIGQYWREVFGEPMQLDIWIGLPESEHARAATMYAAKAGKPPQPEQFYRDLATTGTLVRQTFTSPAGLHSVSGMNAANVRSLSMVSFGGIGSASGLAKFYGMLANRGEFEGRRVFTEATLAQMTSTLSSGIDRVFQIPTAFSAGFMKDPRGGERRIFGPSELAFGHPGAGGSHAFADPENGIAFAYVMNQMEQSLLPNEKSLRLVRALYS
ncbi:MAG: Putative esterase [uncultured Chthoniobacterales bacterium]|uniref:Esterase n=1 Tax=uncultured Chthoniobacterales bacterium TaxID=1836801 RepID=A0A6J4HJ37_9BACT|nr:MAG: Putative esterase [uncultured Chthoniobacterales bacterium]